MPAENLWGDISEEQPTRTPYSILREQAALLGELTNGLLQGSVTRHVRNKNFLLEFNIVVPALEYYEYGVLSVLHPLELYPLQVGSQEFSEGKECKNEEEFLNTLKHVLSSERVRKVIVNLLSQARADT